MQHAKRSGPRLDLRAGGLAIFFGVAALIPFATHALEPTNKDRADVFRLSTAEKSAIIANKSGQPKDVNYHTAQLEEIIVAPDDETADESLPMRSPTRDIWPGLGAPFWALAHPTQAWRIVLPVVAQ